MQNIEMLREVFGEGEKLNVMQMSCRGIAIFLIALLLIRIAGRRSFGLRAPLDNIIAIMLGAVLSRAVVGASPFLPVVSCCLIIVFLHRLSGWMIIKNKKFARMAAGDKIVLYEHGEFVEENFRKALITHEDLMQGVRRAALTEDMGLIDKVYMERNGEISAIKKS